MTMNGVDYKKTRDIPVEGLLELYRVNNWSAAEKPEQLQRALADSHALVSAWVGDKLVGLGNAISDGHLVVYYPHLLVLPEFQHRGIGRELVRLLQAKYVGFHQQVLIADGAAVEFYRKCGFERAGQTEPMWVFHGSEH